MCRPISVRLTRTIILAWELFTSSPLANQLSVIPRDGSGGDQSEGGVHGRTELGLRDGVAFPLREVHRSVSGKLMLK